MTMTMNIATNGPIVDTRTMIKFNEMLSHDRLVACSRKEPPPSGEMQCAPHVAHNFVAGIAPLDKLRHEKRQMFG